MARQLAPYVNFSGGEIGPEVQGRINLENYAATASLLQNFLPESAGPMHFRPGLKFLVQSPSNAFALIQPFVYSVAQKNLLFLTDLGLRIVANDGIISRPSVTSSISNGTWLVNLTGWTDISDAGCSAAASASGLQLLSNGTGVAGIRRQVTTSSAGIVHALNLVVGRGGTGLYFKVGSASGGDDYVPKTALRTGRYSFAFTPTGSYWVEIWSVETVYRYVTSIAVASAGDMALTTPWSQSTLRSLRFEQQGDVVFVASGVGKKQRIERHGLSSWAITDPDERDGPFLTVNVDESLTITPSVRTGNGSFAASRSVFKSTHVGALWQLNQSGQSQSRSVNAEDQWTTPIKVTGVGATRTFSWTVAGTFVGTVRLQRATSPDGDWTTLLVGDPGFSGTISTTGPGSFAYNDNQSNQILYYRVGIRTGDYTSGTADVTISTTSGTQTGVARITAYSSATAVDMEVLSPFGTLAATHDWAEGKWSDYRGWPKAQALFDGRLWAGTTTSIDGSVSDGYESYAAGDGAADAIQRNIATGLTNPIQWIMGLTSLLVGTEGAEPVAKASNLEEAVTPSNINIRDADTFGSADVQPVKIGNAVIFVERSSWRAMELVFDGQRWGARSLMRLHKNLGRPGIAQIAAAKQPDRRLFFVRSDGVLLVKLYEGPDGMGWARLVTDGTVESVAVLPADSGTGEDMVYVMVARTVNSTTVRYLEKLDPLYLAAAADANRMDSWVRYSGSAANVIGGFSHLIGRTVKVWANGADVAPDGLVVNGSGQITLPGGISVTPVVAGLSYTAQYRSSKLALAAQMGTALAQRARPMAIALLLLNSVRSMFWGQDFTTMDPLPDRTYDSSYDAGPGLVDETTDPRPIPGNHTRDPRLCLQCASPAPVTVQGYVLAQQTVEEAA